MHTILSVVQFVVFVLSISILSLFGIMSHLLMRTAYFAAYAAQTRSFVLLLGRLSFFAAGGLTITALRLL